MPKSGHSQTEKLSETGSNQIISKFFSSSSTSQMDDSLSDFKASKTLKYKATKTQPEKSKTKRVNKVGKKSQTDIRRALKGKSTSKLINESNDFKRVCIESGLDVDPEHLEIAIALSKSLHDYNENTSNPSSCSASEPIEDLEGKKCKVAQIRSTLEQYGFRLPDNVNSLKTNKPKGRSKKKLNVALLKTSASERTQKISDKVSQVLFECLTSRKIDIANKDIASEFNHSQNFYDVNSPILKYGEKFNLDNEMYYVKGIIEYYERKSPGSLLCDWSKIPGRSKSPERESYKLLDMVACFKNKDDFDLLLSGTFKSRDKLSIKKTLSNSPLQAVNSIENSRKSPDLFDDDDSLYRTTEECHHNSISEKRVDLAEVYLNVSSCKVVNANNSFKSNNFNVIGNGVTKFDIDIENNDDLRTKSKTSNQDNIKVIRDLKNMTDLSISSPLASKYERYVSKISYEEEILNFGKGESVLKNSLMSLTDEIDLTQSENISTSYKNEDIYGNNSLHEENIDLTQSSTCSEGEKETSFIHIDDEYPPKVSSRGFKPTFDEDEIDLTQNSSSISEDDPSTNDRFEDPNLGSTLQVNEDEFKSKVCIDSQITKNDFNEFDKTGKNISDDDHLIDLTQSQHTGEKYICDVDEVHCEVINTTCGAPENKSITPSNYIFYGKGLVEDEVDTAVKKLEKSNSFTCSESGSDIFIISDEELNYSIRKSYLLKSEVEISSPTSSNTSHNNEICVTPKRIIEKNSIRNTPAITTFDHSLPEVNIKANKEDINVLKIGKIPSRLSHVSKESPAKNEEYILKTTNVTPMINYNSLSTPDRNKELAKYGLKPIKRSRAIQLLEHLYQQTHPYLEDVTDCVDPDKITVKKRKIENGKCYAEESRNKENRNIEVNLDNDISSRVDGAVIPIDNIISNDIYKATERPDIIGEIACEPSDVVLSKRSNVKYKSCIVPLHVAFHNYVSSRPALVNAILRFEPINIDSVHRGLVEDGHKFDPKDLMKFLDRKCITVKTADTKNNRNKKVC